MRLRLRGGMQTWTCSLSPAEALAGPGRARLTVRLKVCMYSHCQANGSTHSDHLSLRLHRSVTSAQALTLAIVTVTVGQAEPECGPHSGSLALAVH
eukprot:533251-Rhodomonas_salina.1